MDDELKGLMIFRSYYEAAEELPDKQRLALYDAIMRYGFDDIEPDITNAAKAYFLLIKPTLNKSKARAKAGATGGKSKGKSEAEQPDTKPESKPKQTPSKPQANGKQTASDKDKGKGKEKERDMEEDNTPITPSGGGDVEALPEPDPFDKFWELYPKKVGKGDARKAWKKINPDKALTEKILIAVNFAKVSRDWQREGGQYIPHPATWLNGGRWEDELTPGGTNGASSYHAQADKPDPFLQNAMRAVENVKQFSDTGQ